MIGTLIGYAEIFIVFLALFSFLYVAWWFLSGRCFVWLAERREEREAERELERQAAAEEERIPAWDAARAAELKSWQEAGELPSPISRAYPAYQEFTWEWGRLQNLGYELDHDPVVLADGQLMVTYSLRRDDRPQRLRVVSGELPPPPF